MAIDRKWVIYNTLTGVILNELPVSEDNIYLDINNGDEATLVIPAYSLSNEDRVQWTKVFKPWARGIALIDNTKAWDASGAIIFAGPIVKRSFNGREEKITLTAYGIYEYLKKITVPPVWTEVTDATLTETFTADSWAGVYSAILQRGVDDTGKPTGWNFMKTFTGLPTVTGTGYSYTVNVVDQRTVAECFEDIRDNVSAKGNEFKFTPVFTDLDADTLTWTLTVGTDLLPKINYTDLTVPLYEEEIPSHDWRANEYNVDDDNTLIYNKLVINGSTDSVTANLEAVYDVTTDPEMPGLTERYEPGVTLTQAQLDAQKAARIKGSLVGDKEVTLTISQDEALETFTMVGKKLTLDVSLSDKMAGTGLMVRAVGIRFTNANRENSIDVDLMKIQARYPKLPKDNPTDFMNGDAGYDDLDISYGGGADFGNPELDYGTGGGGFDTGGETYVQPPFEPTEPEVSNPNLLLEIANIVSGTTRDYRSWVTSDPSPDGYGYNITIAHTSLYTATTDVIADIPLAIFKTTVNETTNREPNINFAYVGTHTISGAALGAAMNTLPSTVSVWFNGNTPTTDGSFVTCNPTSAGGFIYPHLWTIKNKLYLLLTKQRQYIQGITGGSSAVRYEQKMFTLDINPTDGTLSNLTPLVTKFGPSTWTDNSKVFILPNGNITQVGTGLLGQTSGAGASFFNVDENNVLFMHSNILANYNIVGNGNSSEAAIDLTYWDAPVLGLRNITPKPIKVNFSTPTAPTYTETDIEHIMPMASNTTTRRAYIGEDGVAGTTGEYDLAWIDAYTYYINPAFNSSSSYVYNPYTKKIYGSAWGNLTSAHYTGDITALKNSKYRKVWVLDYGNGERLFTELGDTWGSLVDTGDALLTDATAPLTPIPVGNNIYLKAIITAYNSSPTSPSRFVYKEGSWVKERSNLDGSVSDINLQLSYDGPVIRFFTTSTDRQVALVGNGASSVERPRYVYSEELSPYKALAMAAGNSHVIDTTGKLWTTVSTTSLKGYNAPYWKEINIPLPLPNSKTWKQIVFGGVTGQQAYLALDTDGLLWGWGDNNSRVLANGLTTGTTVEPTQIGTKTWNKISMSSGVGVTGAAAAGIDTDGKLFTWGSNGSGITAQGTSTGTTINPTQVGTDNYIDVDVWRGLMAVTSTGLLRYSGVITGQTTVNVLTDISQSKTWKHVAVGDLHYMAIDNTDKLFALGSNLNGRTGLNLTTGTQTTWTQVNTNTWKDVTVSKVTNTGTTTLGATFAIATNGELYEWGSSSYIGNTTQQNVPSLVGTDTDWVALFINSGSVHALRENGMLYNSVGTFSEDWSGTIASKWRVIFGGELDDQLTP